MLKSQWKPQSTDYFLWPFLWLGPRCTSSATLFRWRHKRRTWLRDLLFSNIPIHPGALACTSHLSTPGCQQWVYCKTLPQTNYSIGCSSPRTDHHLQLLYCDLQWLYNGHYGQRWASEHSVVTQYHTTPCRMQTPSHTHSQHSRCPLLHKLDMTGGHNQPVAYRTRCSASQIHRQENTSAEMCR